MGVIAFKSQDAVETVSRALGCLQRMSFALHDLEVSRGGDGLFRVTLAYEAAGPLSAETFEARIAQIPGVEDVASAVREAPRPAFPAPARPREPGLATARFA